MVRKKIVGGNWKMNMTPPEGVALASQLSEAIGRRGENLDIVICPPFPALLSVREQLLGTGLYLGGQNLHWEEEGAFTGEVSGRMLVACGCSYVIIGHSERRHILGETDAQIAGKMRAALDVGLRPLLCVGEQLAERDKGLTQAVIRSQLESALGSVKEKELARMVIAYEPVWAIGSGKTPTAEEANQVCGSIRELVAAKFGSSCGEALRIQYGGSVNPDNVSGYTEQPHIDGVLVGGASLRAVTFARLVENMGK